MSLYQNIDNIYSALDNIKNQSGTWRGGNEPSKYVYESINSGTTYTRWGKTSCPDNGSEKIYSGFAVANNGPIFEAGGRLWCLSNDPEWKMYSNSTSTIGIMGIEYYADELFSADLKYYDVPCTVCHVSIRSSTIMIPGRRSCYTDWIMEYSGYLMSSFSSDFICIDEDPDIVPGTNDTTYRHHLYFTEFYCWRQNCTPYVDDRQLTCVVCTK